MIQRREGLTGDFPGGPGGVAKTPPNGGGRGSVPGQGIKFHTPQLRVYVLQLKILRAAVKIKDPKCQNWGSAQPNKYIIFLKKD